MRVDRQFDKRDRYGRAGVWWTAGSRHLPHMIGWGSTPQRAIIDLRRQRATR